MFREIFRFEVQNKLRRPAVYIYFAAVLIFTLLSFMTGSLPLGEKQHINSPQIIAFWCGAMSMMMMLVSSSVMGMALYRDIEFTTKDYYLTYPMTQGDYFWGRFSASFLFMLLIAVGTPLGIYIGCKLGPLTPWSDSLRYGPNEWRFYLQPYLAIVVPNLLFTSCLFYGLVALTRNVKVVYAGGVLLFLAYFISIFFLDHTNNVRVMILSDPFLVTAARLQMNNSPSIVQNTQLMAIDGDNLLNRLIWPGVGVAVLLISWWRFNFERFFAGKRDKAAIDEVKDRVKRAFGKPVAVSFSGGYSRQTFLNLMRLELRNIVRDNYFWVIIIAGGVVLGLAFWNPDGAYWVENFPRTVGFMGLFDGTFLFFIFFIILFYTGETLHRDRITRYAFINDSLPPANWVINGSRLAALLIFSAGLSLLPMVVGIVVQLFKGYHGFDLPEYFTSIGLQVLPMVVGMALFAYVVHVVVNNKFAAHGVAVVIWVGLFFLVTTGTFDYRLWLYPYAPGTAHSDMDGFGHMAAPIGWFHAYWLAFGGLLVIVAALFFSRGVSTSLRERLQLIPERFTPVTRVFTGISLVLFLALGAWIYYNITYLNDYATKDENNERAALYERTLKHYDSLPLPVVTRIQLNADLYPEKQQQFVHGKVSIVNMSGKTIRQMLLDGDHISDYRLWMDGKALSCTYPLLWERGFLNWFGPKQDTASYRLYTLARPLEPGDSAVVEVSSSLVYRGFQNGLYAVQNLRNGWVFTGGLPELGYDDDDELSSPYERRKYHLPPKGEEEDIPQDDPVGIRTLKAGKSAHLMSLDVTVSTSGDQVAVGQGDLVGQWKKDGRNYFHYVLDHPGSYPPVAVFSARYVCVMDTVDIGHVVSIRIYHDPAHGVNVQRLMAGYKDALRYFSRVYGPYPYNSISVVEGNTYANQQGSLATLDMLNENYGWNANFTSPDQFDYCYFVAARLTAQQWWRFRVAPNETEGCLDIPEGLAWYDALVMAEHKYGKDNMQWILREQVWPYLFLHRRQEKGDAPLIRSNHWFSFNGKAALELYALRDLIGEDSMDAALRELRDSFAYRVQGPYAGANDLFRCLKMHTPDSVQYFLTDSWLRNRFYDNRVTGLSMQPTGRPDEYKVVLDVHVEKEWIEENGDRKPAAGMADYIDIGVFGHSTVNKATGRGRVNPLYLHRYKLTAGEHRITAVVHGKPEWAGIDPYSKLLDFKPADNIKGF